ncbi:MAG: hypothetical protein Barrevirus25_10, partial [Barrevirus sp.]
GSRTKKKPNGCPFCSGRQVCYHNSLACLKPDLIEQWDYDKNEGIDPRTLSVSSNKMVAWTCPNTCSDDCKHEWSTRIKARTGLTTLTGCPYCAKSGLVCCHRKSLKYLYPELMKQWHKKKNKGIDPSKLKQSSNISVHWLCTEAVCGCPHEWECQISQRTSINDPTGCPGCCPTPKLLCIHTSLQHTHPELAKEWNMEKNGELTSSQVSHGSAIKVWWSCKDNCEHQWKAEINGRARTNLPSGCPFCKNKTEGELFIWLKEQFPNYTIVPQQKYSWCRGLKKRHYPFDFYIVELNLLIELDGPQHFKNISNWAPFTETRQRDIYKMDLVLKHKIRIIRITQTIFKKRKAEMIDILLPHIINKDLKYEFICDKNEYVNHKAMLLKVLRNK